MEPRPQAKPSPHPAIHLAPCRYTRALELLPPGCLNPRTLRIQDVSDISASGQLQQGHGHELEQHEQEEAQLLFRSLLSNRCLALSSAGRYACGSLLAHGSCALKDINILSCLLSIMLRLATDSPMPTPCKIHATK